MSTTKYVLISGGIGIITLLAGFSTGYFTGYTVKTNEVRDAFNNAFSNMSSSSSSVLVPEKKETIVEKKLGDEVKLSNQTFKMKSVREANELKQNNIFADAVKPKAGTKFVVADLSVVNTTNAKIIFDTYSLVDDQKRQYNGYNNVFVAVDNYLQVRDLAPSITENGTVVWEVPTDTKSYYIEAKNTDTKEVFRVMLK